MKVLSLIKVLPLSLLLALAVSLGGYANSATSDEHANPQYKYYGE
jgi:hypothetical protein